MLTFCMMMEGKTNVAGTPVSHKTLNAWHRVTHCSASPITMSANSLADFDFPLLSQSASTSSRKKPTPINASQLLASYKAAQSSSHLYKTNSDPIDRVIGPCLRPGYGLQISSPPGCYVERLVLGLIKNVVMGVEKGKGKEVAVLGDLNARIPRRYKLTLCVRLSK